MKIVHICMSQYSDGWTYQENLLTKYHKKLGYEVTIITSMFCYKEGKLVEDTKFDFEDVNGVRVIRLKKKYDGIQKKMPSYKGFYDILSSEKPDIIFSHGCQYRDVSLVAKYVKNHTNVNLFIDNHADFSNSATNFVSRYILHGVIWKYYARKLIPYAKKFWGVLPARVEFLVNVYGIPKEQCGLLVMGADDEYVEKSLSLNSRTRVRKEYCISEDDFLVVTGGKIDQAKLQTELLMKAISKINNSKVKLMVFGSIDEKIKNRIMKLVDGNRIIYAGWISPEQSYSYFSAADLVVFPGRHSVFWEQVAGQGKPMICRRWPGTQHVDVGGNTVFIDSDNENVIRSAIEKIASDSQLYEKMERVAQREGIENFSYKEIAKKSISL